MVKSGDNSRFLEHSREEAQYFLLLVLKDRAGTLDLRQHFEDLLQEMRLKRSNVRAAKTSFSERVMKTIEEALTLGDISLVKVSEKLQMHPRAIQRRLLRGRDYLVTGAKLTHDFSFVSSIKA